MVMHMLFIVLVYTEYVFVTATETEITTKKEKLFLKCFIKKEAEEGRKKKKKRMNYVPGLKILLLLPEIIFYVS